MTEDELANLTKAAGFVRQSDGSYAKPRIERPHPVVQEQQNADRQGSVGTTIAPPLADNQAGISGGYGTDGIQHRVTIIVRFSTHRRTDLSGNLDTILDCIVRARRRLLGEDTGNRH